MTELVPSAACRHHGGFLLVFILLKNVDVWREQYASAAVMMQVLHFPMTLWYVGGRAHCISKSPQTRHVSVVLFRPIWIASCAFRAVGPLSPRAIRASFSDTRTQHSAWRA